MTIYAVTLEWDDRYVVAPVEADSVEKAIEAAYEWANDGGYDSQDTYDDSGNTYVGHIVACETMEDAENARPHDGDCLEIPFQHRSDSAQACSLLDKLKAMVDAADHVVKNWSRGDLAGAVNKLEAAADEAEALLKLANLAGYSVED